MEGADRRGAVLLVGRWRAAGADGGLHSLVVVGYGDGNVQDVRVALGVPSLHSNVVHVVADGTPRRINMRRVGEGKSAPLIHCKCAPVGSSRRPGNRSSFGICCAEGVKGRRAVLLQGEGSPGCRGDGRRLVYVGDRHRLEFLQRAGVATVRRPHRHLVHVVTVGVGKALVVRRVAKSQLL